MLKTFLFDLGNVLLLFSHQRMFDQLGALAGMDGVELEQRLVADGLMPRWECGQVAPDALQREFERVVGRTVTLEALEQAASDIFMPNEPMFATLHELKKRGFRVVLLSNTCHMHIEFVRRTYDLLHHFDALVLSHEVGATKPDARIYAAARQVIGCEPAECFYTDDIPAYIAAAREWGFDAETFTGYEDFRQQLAVRGIALPAEERLKARSA